MDRTEGAGPGAQAGDITLHFRVRVLCIYGMALPFSYGTGEVLGLVIDFMKLDLAMLHPEEQPPKTRPCLHYICDTYIQGTRSRHKGCLLDLRQARIPGVFLQHGDLWGT